MKQKYLILPVIVASAALVACGEKKSGHDHGDHDHKQPHTDDSSHDDHDHG